MRRNILLGIVVLAAVLRFGYVFATGALVKPTVWEYEQIAINLVEHGQFRYQDGAGLEYRSYVEPMYPLITAAVYAVTDHNQSVMVILQILTVAALAWMTARAAKLATDDDATAIIAALIIAVHPGFIRYSATLHTLVLDSFFFIASGAMLLRYRHEPTLRRGLIAAAVIGLGSLTRPTILVFLAPLCWIAWRSQPSFAARLRRAALLALVAFAILAPWTIRNAVVHRTLMLTRSGSGFVFWLGHNPWSSGGALDPSGREIVANVPPEMQQRIVAAKEAERDEIYREAAWDQIRANPIAAVGRVAQRLYHFWWFSPQWGLNFSAALKLQYRAWWATLLLLMAIGALSSRHRRNDLFLLAALALLISLGQSVYYVEGRHRLAVEPLVVPLAAAGLISLQRKAFAGTRPSTSNP